MPSVAATSAPCSGPAPPNATSAYSRGSMPFCTVRELIAFAMLLLTTVRMPSAARRRSRPSRSASSPITCAAAPTSSAMLPPRKLSWSSRPSTRLASVTVGSRAAAAVRGGAGLRTGALRGRPRTRRRSRHRRCCRRRRRSCGCRSSARSPDSRQSRYRARVASPKRPSVDHADIGAGAADVEGDELAAARQRSRPGAAEDAGGRPREQGQYRVRRPSAASPARRSSA